MRVATVAFVVIGVVWGASFLFIRVLVDAGMTPVGVGAARSTLGILVLLPLSWIRRSELRLSPGAWYAIAALGVVNIAAPWTLIPLGEQRIASGVASVGNATAPLWAVGFTLILLPSEGLTLGRFAGILLGLAGVGILSADDLEGLDVDAAAGTAMVCLATCCYGFAVVAIRRWFLNVPPLALATGQIGAGAVVMMPAALASGAFDDTRMGGSEWASLVTLGAVGSGVIFLLYMDLVRRVGSVRAIVVTYLMPPIGVFLGWWVLDEPIGWSLLASLVLTLGGVAVVQGARIPMARWRRV